MKITSQQKKRYLPLMAFIVLLAGYIASLGSVLAIFLAIPMAASLAIFMAYNAETLVTSVKAWIERDGWK